MKACERLGAILGALLAVSTGHALAQAVPELSAAEQLRVQARQARLAANAVSMPGQRPWVEAGLQGTEWRPSPSGETDLWTRGMVTEPEDDYAEPTPESLAAEEARAVLYAAREAEAERLMRQSCSLLEQAAQVVRDAWPAGLSGMGRPLHWLARDADYPCEAERLALLGEIASLSQLEDGAGSDAYRSAVYEQALAMNGAIQVDEAEKAEVFARLDRLDAERLEQLRVAEGAGAALAEMLLSAHPFSTEVETKIARYSEAAEIRARVFGPHDYRTHDAIQGVAMLLGAEGRYDEASALEASIDPALETGRDPLEATIAQASAGNLFGLFYASGDLASAQAVAEEGLAQAIRDYGVASPEVGGAANRLAVTLLARGDYAGAQPLLIRAVEIAAAETPPLVPVTLLSAPEALDAFQTAFVAANGHAAALGNLAYVLAAQGQAMEAEAAYRQALAIRTAMDGATGTTRVPTLVGLGELLVGQGREEGRVLLEQAVALTLSANYEETGSGVFARKDLAALHEREGRLGSAEALLLDALSFVDISNAPSETGPLSGSDLHQNGPPLMTALGRVRERLGRRDEAAPLFLRANRAHFARWCPQGDARLATRGDYAWTYDDPTCQAHPDFTQAVADQARFLQSERSAAATRAWRHAGDMALGRTRLRYSRSADARRDFQTGSGVHRAFVSSAWATAVR